MRRFCETASFRADDPDCLVAASLACSRCLSSDVAWALRATAYDAAADCRCRACARRFALHLTLEQAVRLSMHEERPLDPVPHPEDARAAAL
ncbi:MAG: hypothetical protein M3N16_03735 [Actinomycetota bacterium]|nr:hypothetical protein [Actinomycetota bacterium]